MKKCNHTACILVWWDSSKMTYQVQYIAFSPKPSFAVREWCVMKRSCDSHMTVSGCWWPLQTCPSYAMRLWQCLLLIPAWLGPISHVCTLNRDLGYEIANICDKWCHYFYCMCVIRLSCRAKLPMCSWVKVLYKSTVLKVLYKSTVLKVLCGSTWLKGPCVCALRICLSLCVCLIFCVMPGYWFQAGLRLFTPKSPNSG